MSNLPTCASVHVCVSVRKCVRECVCVYSRKLERTSHTLGHQGMRKKTYVCTLYVCTHVQLLMHTHTLGTKTRLRGRCQSSAASTKKSSFTLVSSMMELRPVGWGAGVGVVLASVIVVHFGAITPCIPSITEQAQDLHRIRGRLWRWAACGG